MQDLRSPGDEDGVPMGDGGENGVPKGKRTKHLRGMRTGRTG